MSRRRPQRTLAHPAYWPTWLGIGLLRLSVALPQPGRLALGRALGALLYRLAGARRHITEVNIGLCFPELAAAARQQRVRETFAANATGLLETALAWWASDRALAPLLRIEGMAHLEAAQARGRGVLLLGAHFTTLDLAGRLLALSTDFDVIYRRAKNPVMDRIIRRNREQFFGHVIERGDIRQILRCLKAGRTVWYAPDQDYGRRHSVFAPFFGVSAATITATARLARMNGSPVLFMGYYREADGHYRLVIEPPLSGFPSGDDAADAATVNRVLEAAIRRQPAQYMWVHRRFKTRPAGEASPYQRKP